MVMYYLWNAGYETAPKYISHLGKYNQFFWYFDCIVKNVKRKDNLIKIVADKEAENPLIYVHYYVEPFELRFHKYKCHKII